MDTREALYTTRAMRRVKPDPIPEDVQARILDAAIRAPSGGNTQGWAFMLVDDQEQKEKIGSLYRECIDILWSTIYKDRLDAIAADPDSPRLHPVRQDQEVGRLGPGQLLDLSAAVLRVRSRRSERWVDLAGGVERPARSPAPKVWARRSPAC